MTEGCEVAWFRCFIRAENFPGQLIGEAGLLGFYTTRFVEANDAEAAETVGLESLRGDPRFAALPGYTPTGQAKVYFQKIDKIAADQVPAVQPGISWYPMENGDDNEGAG